MRQYQEQYRAPLPKISFGGLDTKHSELFTPGNFSPDMMNIDLRRAGAIRKRDGMSLVMTGATAENQLPGSGTIHQLNSLTDNDKNVAFAVRGDTVYFADGSGFATAWDTDAALVLDASGGGSGGSVTAPFTIEPVWDDDTGWIYCGGCLYLVTGDSHPLICYGDTYDGDLGMPWPKGSESGTLARGYPDRWDNYDGLGIGNEDWPKYLYYGGDTEGGGPENAESSRLYAWGFDQEPTRIDYSVLGVPYSFMHEDLTLAETGPEVDGGFFFCMRGDGDKVVGVRQLADLLVVFKRRRTVIYHGGVGTGLNQVSILPVGAVSNESIISAENDIYFWSDGGPRTLSGVIKYGSVNQSSIAYNILDEVYKVSSDSLSQVRGRYESAWNRIVWHVGTEGSTAPDICMVYYLPDAEIEEGRWSKWNGAYAETLVDTVSRSDNSSRDRIFALDEDGHFFEMNSGAVDGVLENPLVAGEFSDSQTIEAYYTTSWDDLGVLTIDKRLLGLFVAYGEEGRAESTISYALNYNLVYTEIDDTVQTYDGNQGATGIWDHADWDDPSVTTERRFFWDTTSQSLVKYALPNLGFTIRFKIYDNSSFGFSIDGMVLDVAFKGKV